RRRHTRSKRDWSSDVCSSDLHSPHPLDVVHARVLPLGQPYCDHVHTYPGHMPAAPLEPDPCQPAQPGELAWGHRLGGVPQPQGAAGLDLHDDQVVTIECDQVDLALTATPVALHHLGAGTFDPLLRQVLPGAADLVLAGH